MSRLLIISNNVLSRTNNNGKTILSFIDGLKGTDISQLFTSGELPRIDGYDYFRITDKDILHGLLSTARRGSRIQPVPEDQGTDDFSIRKTVGRNHYTLMARDLLWHRKWKSPQLLKWLDECRPDAVFFVAGDTLFSYEICRFIRKRYSARLTVYVTDDYIMPRMKEKTAARFRRKQIRKAMKDILNQADCFYTICEPMQKAYEKELGCKSSLAVNMTEDIRNDTYTKTEKELILTYAGSFYYQRADVLSQLAKGIRDYNTTHPDQPAKLMLYSNQEPETEIREKICLEGASSYEGSLNSEQLKKRLNTSDILVFAESFEPEQIEKVRYSLSTKVPEYMSTGKAILAIGPKGIGSMDYLSDTAFCINHPDEISQRVTELLSDPAKRETLGKRSRGKYLACHNKEILQRQFAENVLGNGVNE